MQSFIFASEHLLTNQNFKILICEKDRYILAFFSNISENKTAATLVVT